MPRRSATSPDAPPLHAGRPAAPTLVVAVVLMLLVGGVWAVVSREVVDWLAGGFAALAAGGLGWLLTDALVDRRRASTGLRSLASNSRPPEWATAARTASRQHAERAAATLADGIGDPYLSTQRYVSEYFRRANSWVAETNRRLQDRFPLVALAAVLGVLAAVCRMTPARAQQHSFLELGWPAVLSALLATAAGVEVLARRGVWERVFAVWREWATDSETPDLPPPSPAVELVTPPKPKKPTPPPPAPPSVVELVAPPPPPPPPKVVSPPPPPVPSAFERLKNLDLNPSPDDDNDRK